MKVAFVFPGYGSQFVGMGKELYDNERVVQEYFEQAAHCLDFNFVKLCFASSDAEISKLDNSLVAIFLVSASVYSVIKEKTDITPDLVAGYGTGGFAALFAAGGINFPDGLYLINKYISFYQDHLERIDVRLFRIFRAEKELVERLCKELTRDDNFAYISSYETEKEHLVICNAPIVDKMHQLFNESGIKKIKEVKQIEGLHSRLMEPVAESLSIYSEKVDFKNLKIPMLKSSDALMMDAGEDIKSAMMQHMLVPLQWYDCLRAFKDCDLVVEIGPGTMLQKQVKSIYPDKDIISINKLADIELLQQRYRKS